MLFASLHYLFTPLLGSAYVSQGDFLRVIAYGVLMVGAWRAIRYAEFGRAVAEERARVAREIHDGLAQYLFAVATHATMLESVDESARGETIANLKQAAAAAQQEARFAVLALSSASGTAPFDAALRRYVDFLTADGVLAVELDIDPTVRLAPDEQIEVFRIVQEGLANVRKHANATRAEVTIGERTDGERVVSIRDDGEGFDGEATAAGQGLKNIRARAETIDGGFTLRSRPGFGTALEVVLRT
jgi:signal transduction histidine kinase